MPRLLKSQLCEALAATGLDSWMGALAGLLHRPWVSGYHAVVADDAEMQEVMPGLAITARTFEQHVDWMSEHFELVSLDELTAALPDRRALALSQKPLAAITFDDGYRGVYDHAFPILQRKGVPATLFVVSERVGAKEPLPHDRIFRMLCKRHSPEESHRITRELLHSLAPDEAEKLAAQCEPRRADAPDLPVTWAMVHKLHDAGWTIGSHTRTHARLIACSPSEMVEEVTASKRILEEKVGAKVIHFAYPDGAFNPAAIAAVHTAGYKFAYTTCAHRDPQNAALTIPRTMLWERSSIDTLGRFSPSILACQSSGILELISGCRVKHLAPALH